MIGSRTTAAAIAALLGLAVVSGCGDTSDQAPTSSPSSTTSSTQDVYNDVENNGEQPAEDGDLREGQDPNANPDADQGG